MEESSKRRRLRERRSVVLRAKGEGGEKGEEGEKGGKRDKKKETKELTGMEGVRVKGLYSPCE